MFSCQLFILFISLHSLAIVARYSPPVIIQIPKDTIGRFPLIVELHCEAKGDPTPDISWYNAVTKEKIVDRTAIKRKRSRSIFTYRAVSRDKRYSFYCNASNPLGHAYSPSATATESYIEYSFQIDLPRTTKVSPGNTATFSCQAPIGIPFPKITWLKNGRVIYPRDNPRYEIISDYKSTLKIRNTKSDDLGKYECLAENLSGRLKSSASSLLFKSSLEVSKELTFTAENTANITCPIATNMPLEWVREDGGKMNPSRITSAYNYLLFTNIQQSDSGKYICRTLSQSGKPMEEVIRVIVQSSPTFLVTPEDKTVFEGEDVIFKCTASGYPFPEVYWEGPVIGVIFPDERTNSRFKVEKDGSLHVNNVQTKDAGKVTCNCHSSLGYKSSSAHLTVKKRDLAYYPVISLPPQNQTLVKGSTATFRCEVVSNMDAVITWYMGPKNDLLQPSDQISIPTRGALQIKEVDPSRDTNIYTCEAILKNEGMKTRWTAFLRVIEPSSKIEVKTPVNDETELPLPPVLDLPFAISSDSVGLSWSTSANHKYWIEYVRFGSPEGWIIYKKDWKYSNITVKSLKPDSWYQFLVRARNTKGLSRASVPTEYIKTQSRSFSKVNVNNASLHSMFSQIQITISEIQPIQFGKVKVDWQMHVPESFELVFITGFRIHYSMNPLEKCLNHRNLPSLPKKTYCSLNDRSEESISLWLDQNGMSHLPSTSQVHPNQTSGVSEIGMRMTDSNVLVKGLVGGLSPFSCYEVWVEAFSDQSLTSPKSPAILSLMMEDIPYQPPHSIKSFWSQTPNVLIIQWMLPSPHSWNGILTGFTVHMFANDSQNLRESLKFTNITTEVQIPNLDQTRKYSFHMSLSNCQGEGIRSKRMIVPRKSFSGSSTYEQQVWFIPLISVGTLIFWIMLCSLVVYLCCVRYHLISSGPKFKSKDGELNLQPLITSKDARFFNSRSQNSHDNPADGLYSDPLAINRNNLTTCSMTSSSCTPYATTSIIDHGDNTFCNFYQGSVVEELGSAQAAVLPPYPTFSQQYTSYPHNLVSMPYAMTTSTTPTLMNSASINSPIYSAKDDNYPNIHHGKCINPPNAANILFANLKMGISHLASSTSGTSSSGSVVPKKNYDKNASSVCAMTCAAVSPATFGSSSPSPSAAVMNDEQDLRDGSLKSVVLYDVIPSGETGDECHEDSSQSSDLNNEDYESGSEMCTDHVDRDHTTGTTIDDDSGDHNSPGYSTDSVTYSSVPHRPYPRVKRPHQMRGKPKARKPKL